MEGNQSKLRKPPKHGENMQTPDIQGDGENRTPDLKGARQVLLVVIIVV